MKRHVGSSALILSFLVLFSGSIMAAPAEDFSSSWRYPAAGKITGICRGREGEVVYFLCEDRSMYAVSAGGTPLWKSHLGGQVASYIKEGPDGTIYAVLLNGSLVAVNPRGRIIWTIRDLEPASGTPAFSPGGVIYYATTGGTVYSISHTGRERWSIDVNSPVAGSPEILSRYLVLITGNDGNVWVVDSRGDVRWQRTFDPGFVSVVYSRIPMVVFVGNDRRVAFYSSSGMLLYEYDVSIQIPSVKSIFPVPGGVLLLTREGKVFRLQENGDISHVGNLPPSSLGILGVSVEGRILGFDADGSLSLDSEGIQKGFNVTGVATGPPVLVSGELIVWGGEDWILYAAVLDEPMEGSSVEQGMPPGEQDSYAALSTMNYNYRYLMYLVDSKELNDKEEALRELKEIILSNDSGLDREYGMYLLTRLASQGVIDPIEENGVLINNFPQIRSSAVEILGRQGDFFTRDYLLRLMRYEFDNYALAMEIRAVGELKSDPQGRTGEVFNHILRKQMYYGPDNSVAGEMIRAIGKISNYHGSIDKSSIETLFTIFRGNYSKQIRSLALKALEGVGK